MKQERIKNIILATLVFLIVSLAIVYSVQANNVATSGYSLQTYKSKIANLRSENTNLELKLSEVKSLGFLEEKVADLEMIEAKGVDYISNTSEVAVK